MMPPAGRAEGLAWGLGENRAHFGSIRPEPIADSLVKIIGLLPSPGRSPHAGAVTGRVRYGRAALSRLSPSGVRGVTRPIRRRIHDGARVGAGEALKRYLRFPTVFPVQYTAIGGSTSASGPSLCAQLPGPGAVRRARKDLLPCATFHARYFWARGWGWDWGQRDSSPY